MTNTEPEEWDVRKLYEQIEQLDSSGHAVYHSTEAVISFVKRFQLFKDEVIYKKGPLGVVNDWWYRLEYQGRGAMHIHLVVWCDRSTIPHNVISAEMPRGDPGHPMTYTCRKYVSRFQIHEHVPRRCFRGAAGKSLKKCKYGFDFNMQKDEELDDTGIRYLYKRSMAEDTKIVPYNMNILLLWGAHINVQKVTAGGWELYLAKYVSKGEKSFDIPISESASEPEKFIRTRIVGRIEADVLNLGLPSCAGSREIIYLPTQIQSDYKYLKRQEHMPADQTSGDIFYSNTFEKYLERPAALKDMTYPDYFRYYRICREKDENPESNITATGLEKHVDCKGRKITKRKVTAIPRWAFYLPFGDRSEKFYEQKLLLNVPFTIENIGSAISSRNQSKTFAEECIIRGLIDDEQDALDTLKHAVQRGYSIERIHELARLLVQANIATDDQLGEYLAAVDESRPALEGHVSALYEQAEDDFLKHDDLEVNKGRKSINLDDHIKSFSPSQEAAYKFIEQKFSSGEQLQGVIVGPAGTGKSYLLQAIEAAAIQKGFSVRKLATTGAAAYLIGGTTLHYFLKLNLELESSLEKGTLDYLLVQQTDIVIVDEFSMMADKWLISLEKICRETAIPSKRFRPYGGKTIILIGDPMQIAPIENDIYSTYQWGRFTPIVLKETLRAVDPQLIKVLRHVRENNITPEIEKILHTRLTSMPRSAAELGDAIIIVSKTKTRNKINNNLITTVSGQSFEFEAQDTDGMGRPLTPYALDALKRFQRRRYPDKITLKVGARVILLRNLSVQEGFVNGTICRVLHVNVQDEVILLKNVNNGKEIPITRSLQDLTYKGAIYRTFRNMFPIDLAYAITAHKCQGMTLDKVFVHLNKEFFGTGQAYVALSRTKTLSSLFLTKYQREAIKLDGRPKEVMEKIIRCDILQENPSGESLKLPIPVKIPPDVPTSSNIIHDVQFPKHVPSHELSAQQSSCFIDNTKFAQVVPPDTTIRKETNVNCVRQELEVDSQRHLPQVVPLGTSSVRQKNEKRIFKQVRKVVQPVNPKVKIFKPGGKRKHPDTYISGAPNYIMNDIDRICLKAHRIFQELNQFHTHDEMYAFLNHEKEWIEMTIDLLRSWPPVTIKDVKLKRTNQPTLHPALASIYLPVQTSADGNCGFNMVSICLYGDERLNNLLRVQTLWDLLQHQVYYIWVIDQTNQYDSTTSQGKNDYNTTVDICKTDYAWANEFHLLAMCLILQRDFHIFTTFIEKSTGDHYFSKRSVLQIQKYFQDHKQGTRPHVIYKVPDPKPGSDVRTPLRGFHYANHYTALVPKNLNVTAIKPWSVPVVQPYTVGYFEVLRAGIS